MIIIQRTLMAMALISMFAVAQSASILDDGNIEIVSE